MLILHIIYIQKLQPKIIIEWKLNLNFFFCCCCCWCWCSRLEIVIHWHRWQHALIQHPANWPALTNWTVHSFIQVNNYLYRIKLHQAVKISMMVPVIPALNRLNLAQHKELESYLQRKFNKKKKNEVNLILSNYIFFSVFFHTIWCNNIRIGRFEERENYEPIGFNLILLHF